MRTRMLPPTRIIAALALTGCASMDPWDTTRRAPSGASSLFLPDDRGPALVERPRGAPVDNQADVEGKTLTLAQCIRLGLERNPRTRAAWHASRAAAAEMGRTRAACLPNLEFSARGGTEDAVSLVGTQDVGRVDVDTAAFSVRYLLFDGGTRSAEVQAAEAELLAMGFSHNTTLQDVALDIEESYYALLAAEWAEKVARETVKQTHYHVRLTRARHDGGLVTRSDVLIARTEEANARLALVRAQSDVKVRRGRLANAIGVQVSLRFRVVDIPEDIRRRELDDIDELLKKAAQDRPALQRALAEVTSRSARVKAAHARFRPTVSMDASYGWNDREFPPQQDEWSAGIALTMPLFAGFDQVYRTRRAQADLAQAKAGYERLLRKTELEIWTAFTRLIEAGESIEAAHTLVTSAKESAALAEAEYKNGTGSIIGLIDAQTVRTGASRVLVQTKLDWYTALARLERAVGRTLAEKK